MKLTALDIRKQEFSRTLRGYDPDEVESFIEVLSDQWKEMVDELKRDNDRISQLELKLEHYHKVEEALEEALQTARTSARQTIVQADVKAKKIIEAAEEDAEKITRDARDHRQEIKREAAKFSVRRKEIVAKLRAFLLSEMEMLAHYDDDDPTGFIKLLGDASGVNGGNQPQLAAGDATSDALETGQPDEQVEKQHVPSAPAEEHRSSPESFTEESDVDHAEAVSHADVHVEPTNQANAPTPAPEQTQPARESRPAQPVERPRDEADAPGSPSSESDNNDSFHSDYERMATIEDVYGQFDPDTAGNAADPADADSPAESYTAEGDAHESYTDESYTDESYSQGDYAAGEDEKKDYATDHYTDEAYAADSREEKDRSVDYQIESGAGNEYPDEVAGDGYAESRQGTTPHSHEYPNQSRPAQDRPPADSPAASGQRAPGMNRPDSHQELSESATEDIEKIRRILEDLDS